MIELQPAGCAVLRTQTGPRPGLEFDGSEIAVGIRIAGVEAFGSAAADFGATDARVSVEVQAGEEKSHGLGDPGSVQVLQRPCRTLGRKQGCRRLRLTGAHRQGQAPDAKESCGSRFLLSRSIDRTGLNDRQEGRPRGRGCPRGHHGFRRRTWWGRPRLSLLGRSPPRGRSDDRASHSGGMRHRGGRTGRDTRR